MKLNKDNVIMVGIAVAVVMVFLSIMYMATMKTGMYITADNGVETHHYLKVDVFGNEWDTGTKSFVLRSR